MPNSSKGLLGHARQGQAGFREESGHDGRDTICSPRLEQVETLPNPGASCHELDELAPKPRQAHASMSPLAVFSSTKTTTGGERRARPSSPSNGNQLDLQQQQQQQQQQHLEEEKECHDISQSSPSHHHRPQHQSSRGPRPAQAASGRSCPPKPNQTKSNQKPKPKPKPKPKAKHTTQGRKAPHITSTSSDDRKKENTI